MEAAGYSEKDIADIKKQLDFYLQLREEVRKASGETLDLKTYEADMRYLIDNYIQADEPQKISPFGDLTFIDIIVNTGIADAISYEEYLQKIAALAKKVNEGKSESTPDGLNTPAKRTLYNNLSKNEDLALAVHEKIITYRPDNWKGNKTKELVIKSNLYEVLGDEKEVERIFPIVKKQGEY